MSSTGSIETTLSKSQRGTVEANRSKFNDLMPPEEEWVADELPNYLRTGFFKTLERRKLIENVGFETVEGSRVKVWRTKEEVWAFLQELESRDSHDRDRLLNPCGHMGFTNLVDEPGYECNTCGARFVKAAEAADQKFDWPDQPFNDDAHTADANAAPADD